MKVYIVMFLAVLSLSCEKEYPAYDKILSDLEYNFTRDPALTLSKIDCNNYNRVNLQRDSKLYENAVKDFYISNFDMIDYLLRFKNDTSRYCDWVNSRNSCSSKFYINEMISRSRGSLILIDNYLLNPDHDTVRIPSYIDRVDYNYFEKHIFNRNSKQETKQAYSVYVENLLKSR
ncbi:hypothetical protein [Flavobacterium sp.]|uniref:hypothetical protein n=1 Tax=Flavobacterium sp. TaxID=239 RepID=UPI0026087B89|nr:hypothetical protein [Flavobacterium sp.]